MIGYNRIFVTRKGIQTYVVPAEEQIAVKKGDVIGYHYDSWDTPQSEAVIPHADVVKQFPYSYPDDFYDGFSKNMGHSDIMSSVKRVNFNGFKHVRCSSRNYNSPNIVDHGTGKLLSLEAKLQCFIHMPSNRGGLKIMLP